MPAPAPLTFPTRLRRTVLILLLGLVVGQAALLAHAMDHALEEGDPVCEVCTASQSTADTTEVLGAAPVLPSGGISPFLSEAPPRRAVRHTPARDPPRFPFLEL